MPYITSRFPIDPVARITGNSADPEGKDLWMMMGDFNSITRRIDFVYATEPMFAKNKAANVIFDDYTRQQKAMKDGKRVSKFFRPSDYLPIIVDFSK